MPHNCPASRLHRALIPAALLFGLLTLFAGGRVLLGADPGFRVLRPLLVFNTLMGVAYVAAAVLLRRDLKVGRRAAGAIAAVNLSMLAALVAFSWSGGAVAVNSVGAMTLRTAVWVAVFALAGRVLHGAGGTGAPGPARAS